MSLKIDEEFKNLIPPLTTEEFSQLEENILQEGIREKIITWNGIIIDGHNRYEIAKKHHIGFMQEEKEFESRKQIKEYMILNQFGRRNLTIWQRSELALKLKPIFEEKAKENQTRTTENRVCQKSDEQKIDTKKELAKIAGVSHDTIHKVEVITTTAPANIKEQVKAGDISINQAYILTRSAEETKKKNEENEKRYKEQLEKEKQIEKLETSLPENTVVLDKFRKEHIFGITDFNKLTNDQYNSCLGHARKCQKAITAVALLSTTEDSLKAWGCTLEKQEEVQMELEDIGSAIQVLLKMQNYFKGVKKQ